ncbi:MAG: zinc ribbon domain-containing protein [Thermoflexales bacterium]|nr:zinc ribbon domain-containing protein [Thermoflexales bacterium]MDW8351038.1 zinc ribbon domain-containing protein [Anaerolineae bacterium]
MAENISSLIVAAVSLCGAVVAALLAGMTIWTFRDIRSRTRDPFVQILATVMVGVIPIAGILVYFMLRPRETLSEQYVRALEEESLLASIENQEFCPTCGRRVDADMQFCPSCHTKLRNACPSCGRAVHLSWDLCPYCGGELTPELPTAMVKRPQPKRVAVANAPQVSAPAMAAVTPARVARPSMLDRVSEAIGGIVERVTSLAAPPTANGQMDYAEVEEDVPAAPPPANARANTANSIPPQPRPAKRPTVNREELE